MCFIEKYGGYQKFPWILVKFLLNQIERASWRRPLLAKIRNMFFQKHHLILIPIEPTLSNFKPNDPDLN